MNLPSDALVAPVEAALNELESVLDKVIGLVEADGLTELSRDHFVTFTRRFEQHRNRLARVDHGIVAGAEERDLGQRFSVRHTAGFLALTARITKHQAHQRVEAARLLGRRTSMTGEDLPPERAVVAEAQSAGEVSPQQAEMINSTLATVGRVSALDADELIMLEQEMVDHAGQFGPRELRACLQRIEAHHDPDGVLPDEDRIREQRFVHLVQRKDGSYVLEGRLTRDVGAALEAVLTPLAKPRPTEVGGQDLRSAGQRMHDAVEDVTGFLLRSGDLPRRGGLASTVMVTIDFETLMARSGLARTSMGAPIPVPEMLSLCQEAEIIPVVLDASGAVLSAGRTSRLATPQLTQMLYARDGGCSFPGCDAPPEFCERHHVIAWLDGGETKIDNLTLLCRYHHHTFLDAGWRVEMRDGLPYWFAPTWFRDEQVPLLHHRIKHRRDPVRC